MKQILLIIILILSFQIVNAQYLIVGDTTDFEVTSIEEVFLPDSRVSFDMDCDGIEDFWFNSKRREGLPIGMCSFVERIGAGHDPLVKARVSPNTGYIDTFKLNDTLLYNGFWYELYGGIYDACQSQGVSPTNNVFLIFRKTNNNDTSYIQIKFSNNRAVFTIHEIISECDNPFTITYKDVVPNNDTINVDTFAIDERVIYPNPFKDEIQINVDINEIKQVNLYDNTGSLVHQSFNTNRIQNLDFLSIGIYFIEIIDIYDNRTIDKILKIDDF